jgi:4-hydroxy-3-methylbut-2-enyl diphosphate reductase
MKIIIGKYSGFCTGVNYTYIKAKQEVNKGKTYCLGHLIHNDQVIKELEDMGMITVNYIDLIPDNSRVIFRAHGEPIERYEYAKKHNLEIVDLTCGRVRIIHDKVAKEKDNSYIFIIGKKTHPEIIGTAGFSGNNYSVIENNDDIDKAINEFNNSNMNKIYIVSQTTFSSKKFDDLVSNIKDRLNNIEIKIDKTICDATEKRQQEVLDLSKKCSIILVLGSSNSSNTKELYNIAKENCKEVYFIEEESDLNNIKFKDDDIIGIVAGASAPKYFIDKIVSLI